MIRHILTITVVGVMLVGCQAKPSVDSSSTTSFEPSPYNEQTQETLTAIQTSLRVLAETQRESVKSHMTTAQQIDKYNESRAMPKGLDVTINAGRWEGPIENALKLISEKTGYKLQGPLGKRPVTDVIVTFSAKERTAYDVLRDIGAQAGARAKVSVIVNRNANMVGTIQLTYL
ncbi:MULTISPECIES: DotD/TraH family lipoprotein [Aeromonas]|uniref:DotD/TraH family lipoprotein n=1 Tax=Aeromonas veronii TaxID=654 RepID=A0A4S5CDL7_AERVE|nr:MULTISPECIES: DotD/TraH family lipoprotein [Aeromonas]THJ43660.1 hypothetical protein E8Q35_15250 [Aeromonas veronii]